MSDINDFVIENGVLKKYNGSEQIVNIPDGVIAIGDSAFEGCLSLESVVIPDSVISIGDKAFGERHIGVLVPYSRRQGFGRCERLPL